MMKRGIYSNISSLKVVRLSLIIFIFINTLVLNTFNTAKADIYIRNNLSGSDHILATSSNSTIDDQKINTDVLEGNTSFKYLFLNGSTLTTGYLSALKKDYVDDITTKYNTAIDSIKNDSNKDEEKTDLDNIKNNILLLEKNSETFLDTTYTYVFKTLRNDSAHGYVMSYGGTNQINTVTNKARRLYMYYYFNDQILPIATKYKNSTSSSMQDIYTYTTDKIDKLKNGASGNLYGEEDPLKDEEINGSYIITSTYDVTKGVFIGEPDGKVFTNATALTEVFKLPITTNRQINNGTSTVIPPDAVSTGKGMIASGLNNCPTGIDLSDFLKGLNPIPSAVPVIGNNSLPPSCSIAAYLINLIIQGINSLVNTVVGLAGALFDWIYDMGVVHFSQWVTGSGAYTIYKTIILSLIVSVMTFLVFYLIIRRLIDDDGERMNKILPRLILTALFVYFSFTITGWIIDQSNIITIYLYRSMTHNAVPAESISDVFEKILKINSSGNGINGNFGISLGNWGAVPFTLGQLVVSIVSVFVLFQGAILIFSRTIILLLCMIFSPIMIIPEGLTDSTDKYRKIVIDNFTGNILLGPVFMFLILIAVQIGQITTKMVGNGPSLNNTGVQVPTNFLGGIISSVLVIVVLQLAISAAKSLSGSAGAQISGFVGKYAGKVGGLAFNTGKSIGSRTLGGIMNNTPVGDKINDWITKGSTKSGIKGTLFKGAQNYTTKFRLDGDTKRNTEAEEIANAHHKANEHTQLRIREDLVKRAGSGDKTAILALKQINQEIETKKNTEFKQSKDTRERETYEEEQKNKNSGGNSAGAAPVTENTVPKTPQGGNSATQEIPEEHIGASSNIKTGEISKKNIETGKFTTMSENLKQESKEQKNFIKNRENVSNNEIVKHEYTPDKFIRNGSQDNASNNNNNGSGNQTIHTDNLQVVADNIQLMTGNRMINQARNINQPKALISNGAEQPTTKPKLTILSDNSRKEKNESGQQMKANVSEAKKIGSTTNQEPEDIEFEEVEKK